MSKVKSVFLMDVEDSYQSLEIQFDEGATVVTFVCENGTYQKVWWDHLIKALERLGAISKRGAKK